MTALSELIEAVEAGREPSREEWRVIFPFLPDDDDDYPRCHMAFAANQGWIDAARALHEAVLPGWGWVVHGETGAYVWKNETPSDDAEAEADTPARAWLLAILKALAAQEGGE
jgi:hypothetical protein